MTKTSSAKDLEARKANFTKVKVSFQRLDKDGDGKVSFTELLSALYPYASRNQLKLMKEMVDATSTAEVCSCTSRWCLQLVRPFLLLLCASLMLMLRLTPLLLCFYLSLLICCE